MRNWLSILTQVRCNAVRHIDYPDSEDETTENEGTPEKKQGRDKTKGKDMGETAGMGGTEGKERDWKRDWPHFLEQGYAYDAFRLSVVATPVFSVAPLRSGALSKRGGGWCGYVHPTLVRGCFWDWCNRWAVSLDPAGGLRSRSLMSTPHFLTW